MNEIEHYKRERIIQSENMQWPGVCPLKIKDWDYIQRKYHLSPRELQVAVCICTGYSIKQIAKRLNISTNSVKLYTKNLYLRTGVNNKIMLLLNFIRDISPEK